MRARVVALGQAAAGDDAVGFAVLDELRRRAIPPEVELLRAHDAMALMPLLEAPVPLVIVDAALGVPPGIVLDLDIDDLADQDMRRFSSHGIGVGQVIALARLLAPGQNRAPVHIVAITIAPPERFRVGLSPAVAAAVAPAVDQLLVLVARVVRNAE